MGSVRASFSFSTSDVMTADISLSVGADLLADSGTISRAKVVKTAVDANALEVYTVNDKTESAYLYLKNLDTVKENYVYIYNDTDSDGLVAKIAGLEFCFIPVAVNKTYKVYATKVDSLVDYAVFGLDSSAVTLS